MPEVLVHKGHFIENKMIQRLIYPVTSLNLSTVPDSSVLAFLLSCCFLHSKTLKIFMTITVVAVSLALSFC